MKIIVAKILILFFTIIPFRLFAEVEFLDHAIPELVVSPRSLGAGNANFGEDFGPLTVFLNPASRISVVKHKFGLLNFTGEFNSDTFSSTFGSKGLSFDSVQKGISFLSQSNMRNELIKKDGGILSQRMGVVSFYQFKRFTIGYFSSHFSNGAMVDADSTYYGNRREDYGPYIHFSSLLSRRLLFGITYVYLTRSETFSTENSVASTNQTQTFHGSSNHVILALKYKINRKFLASIVSRDAFSSNFFYVGMEGLPANDPNTVDFAFTWFLSKNRLKLNLGLRDITGKYSDVTSDRKIQFGGEYSNSMKSGIKFGYLDGGPTLGYFYKTRKRGSYSISTHSVNTKITDVRDEDRRVTFELSF